MNDAGRISLTARRRLLRQDYGLLLCSLFLTGILFWPHSLQAAPVELPASGLLSGVKYQALVRADPGGILDPRQLLASDVGFAPYDPHLDQSAPPLWLKLDLQPAPGAGDQYVLLVARRFFQRFELYTANSDGSVRKRTASFDQAVDGDTVGRHYAMELTVTQGAPTTLLLRVETVQQGLQPLELWIQDGPGFSDSRVNSHLVFGLLFGVLIALIFHNLVLYLYLRLRGHLYYVLAMLSLVLLLGVDSGLLQTYLLPEVFLSGVVRLQTQLAAMMLVTISFFFLTFVQAQRYTPRLVLLVQFLLGLLVLTAVALLLVPSSWFLPVALALQSLTVTTMLVLLGGSFLAGRQGSTEGWIFLAAWTLFVAGGAAHALISHDLLSRSSGLDYLLYLGAVIEASILALGLAYRVRELHERHANALREQHRVARLVNVDTLTNAYNRRFLENYLESTLQDSAGEVLRHSVLMLDLDDFKTVNDAHGHAAGDLILQEFVQRCQQVMREVDVLCRLGGDEFVIVVVDREDRSGLHVAERIVDAVGKRPFMFGQHGIQVTTSIGVVAGISPGNSVIDILRMADEALYQAKRAGRNGCVLYRSGQATPVRHQPAVAAVGRSVEQGEVS